MALHAAAKKHLTIHKVKHYGWMPDLPDARDHMYAAPPAAMAALPPKVDHRAQCPAVYDQGQLGSCTGNSIAGALQFDRMKQKLVPDFIPSRLFIYYNERVIEGTVGSDSGAQIRDGIKVVATEGAPPESDWPYDINRFAEKPPPSAFQDALKDRAVQYQRLVQNQNQMKGCLSSGYPFVFGFTVYKASRASRSRRPASCRCRGAGRPWWEAMRWWRLAMTIPSSASSSATPGARRGACRATSQFRTRICSMPISPATFGRSGWSSRKPDPRRAQRMPDCAR